MCRRTISTSSASRPTLGRTFAADEDQLGKHRVAVLSHALWTSQFGADPNVLGRSIILDGEPHTVIGVLPAGGAFDRAFAQIWRPLAFEPENMTRNFHWFGALRQAQARRQPEAGHGADGCDRRPHREGLSGFE